MAIPDAHIHLDAVGLLPAREALCVTCTPAEFDHARKRYGMVALGLHPWQITDDNAEELLAAFTERLPLTCLVGEVGLDFYKQYAQFDSTQSYVFTSICKKLSLTPHLVSLHTRNAATAALDILEATGTIESCTCILHGFNGSSTELARAKNLGCLFSISLRQLKTRRGREYARQLPAKRILLETDADGSRPYTEADWERELEEALALLEEIRRERMRETIMENWERALKSIDPKAQMPT